MDKQHDELPGVSVVIPCYNAATYLRETIDSVLAQEYQGRLEVLVGDDSSTDDSRAIVESFGASVRLVASPHGTNTTTAATRNRCLRAATQPLVAFLDADDLWFPRHLSNLANVMSRRPELGLVYDKGYYMSEDGSVLTPFRAQLPPPTTADELLPSTCFGTGQVMTRRAVFDRVGVFDESLRHSEDQDMWLRILEAFPATHVAEDGFKYRMHPNQKSLKPAVWTNAEKVLEKALKRYPYRRRSVCKRRAILSYRFSQIAFKDRRVFRGTWFLARAAALDPSRAASELMHRWSGR
jgi:glycosyltransferase involved in cell wall biosynthesis